MPPPLATSMQGVVSLVNVSATAGSKMPQQKKAISDRAVAGKPSPYSARQDVFKSDPPKQTHTPPDRTADKLDSATTGQFNAEMDSNWSDSTVTSNQSAS